MKIKHLQIKEITTREKFVLVIVADDLTGALDTAAPFAARGLRTEVVLKVAAVAEGLALLPDVLSIIWRLARNLRKKRLN